MIVSIKKMHIVVLCFDLTKKNHSMDLPLGYFESNNSGIKVHLLQ